MIRYSEEIVVLNILDMLDKIFFKWVVVYLVNIACCYQEMFDAIFHTDLGMFNTFQDVGFFVSVNTNFITVVFFS